MKDLRVIKANYGKLPDLGQVDSARDVVFAWNGTTSGVRVPNGFWIAAHRPGLTICDATSAVFAMDIMDKLDVVTWSWQKVLGGEGAHGMIALSPRAVQRLETFAPIAQCRKFPDDQGQQTNRRDSSEGETINTPSMLCVEDALDGLKWAESIGGLRALIARSQANLKCIEDWVAKSSWAAFLAEDRAARSSTSICLKIIDRGFQCTLHRRPTNAGEGHRVGELEKSAWAYDIGSYRDAPVGLRIWGGATVETSDIQALLPWLDWAYAEARSVFTQTSPVESV